MSLRERPAPRGSPASRCPADPVPVTFISPIPTLLDFLRVNGPRQAGTPAPALPPLEFTEPPADLPAELDPPQRSAVALALRTPDVALIRVTGADQSRLVGAILATAGRRRETATLVDHRQAPAKPASLWGVLSHVFGRWRRSDHTDTTAAAAHRPDLVVVSAAHAARDDELRTAAGRGRRAVLIGEAGEGAFGRLWTLLHCEPWRRDGGRLIGRLRPLPPGGRLEREPVADRPDVELCIHTPTDGPPELVEVAFPADTPVARAVEYVFKELGELPVSSEAQSVLGIAVSAAGQERADLGGGVNAIVRATTSGWAVPAVEFGAGWDREQASAWMHRHAVPSGSGRTVDLAR